MKNRTNEKGKRGEWRLRSGNGLKWLAVGGTVRRA
jgi:hypothetical protein